MERVKVMTGFKNIRMELKPLKVKDVSWALQFVDMKCIEFPQGVENAASVMPGTESVVTIEPKSFGIMEIREYTDSEKTAYRIRGEQVVPGFVIKGVSGSVAEKYALENRIQFVALN